MTYLTEEQLTKLHTHLVVPIAVGDILYNNLAVEDDTQYGLHEALSEIDPDSALLAIAVSAKHIALRFARDIPVAAALSIEAGKIIDDYGPDWLTNYSNGPLDEDRLFETLRHVPEDLESIADLLETLRFGIPDTNDPAARLCDILAIQARAHMEIADYILKEIEGDEGELFDLCNMVAPKKPAAEAANGDNIILFPIHRRQ